MNNIFLNSALEYRNKYDFSVIPCSKNKVPLVKWEEFQKRIATEEEIKKWWSDYPDANVGIVTGIISGIAVIDIDTDEGKEAIQDYIPDSLITPTVETPRGGQHLYFKCTDAKLTSSNRNLPGCDLKANGGLVTAPPSTNGKGGAYTWIVSLKEDIALLPTEYNIYIKNILSSSYKGKSKTEKDKGMLFVEGRRNEDLFHIANCLTRGSARLHEKVQVLEILAKNCDPPYPENEIKTIIESALNRKTRGDAGITEEIKSIISYQNGIFCVSDVIKQYQEYQNISNISNSIKVQVRVILKRLKDLDIIERYGAKAGVYRTVERSINKIDFLNAPDKSIPLLWPFGIEEYALLYPGNICIVAGTSNAGKTALLLNFTNMNMDKFKIRYQSSEMGAIELRRRLSKFNTPLGEFEKAEWIDRATDWWDLIEPEGINIIDYMEIHEEHYKIGAWIKKIFDKLTTGIAIIALQKPAHRELGVGGATTLEKARLYLSVDFDKITMVKVKNWATNINPNGLSIPYELLQGVHFISDSKWLKEIK
ncbi:MAG: bifunctional DNA primase/polymerase [Nanoarchaeota archaeon]